MSPLKTAFGELISTVSVYTAPTAELGENNTNAQKRSAKTEQTDLENPNNTFTVIPSKHLINIPINTLAQPQHEQQELQLSTKS